MIIRVPASQTNPGFAANGYRLTNFPVNGHNDAETKISFALVANSLPSSVIVPGLDTDPSGFDDSYGDVDIKTESFRKKSKFTLRRQ